MTAGVGGRSASGTVGPTTLLKRESTAKVGIKNKRLPAAWDENYLEKMLFGK